MMYGMAVHLDQCRSRSRSEVKARGHMIRTHSLLIESVSEVSFVAGDSGSVVVRFVDVRRVQRERRSLLDGVTAAPLLHQLGPLHRRHGPVQLRAPDDASARGADAGRRLDGVRQSLAHPDTPRTVHDSITTRQACHRH